MMDEAIKRAIENNEYCTVIDDNQLMTFSLKEILDMYREIVIIEEKLKDSSSIYSRWKHDDELLSIQRLSTEHFKNRD